MRSPMMSSWPYSISTKGMPCIVCSNVWKWYCLAHACLRWRHIVLASTCHLCLQRFHRLILPARISPDSWPPLPIIIHYLPLHAVGWPEENTVATFEHEIDKAYATTCSSVAMKLSLSWEKAY